jgi:CRP-like cAMP-binding protein
MEASLLRKVRAKEFHGAGFSKRNAEEIAPNLTKVINLSNHVTNWIITEILKMKTVEEMAEMISKFIKVGKHMQQMHNFSGVCEISSALNNAAIAKLKAAWQILPPKTKEVMDEINEAVSPLAHYKNYREAFKARDPEQPCLPILVATLADLIVFEEVLNSKLPDGSVNWNKMTKVAERIWETVALNCVYPIRPVPELIQYIESSAAWRESATTCAIADLKMKEITKANDKTAENKKSKRRSTSSFSLVIEPSEGPKDELSESDWKILLTGSQPIKFKNGEVILKTGIPNEHLFRIKEGKVKVVKEIDGNMIAVATMGDGAMFGEISMLNRSQKGTTTASIVADGEVEIWQLQIDFVLHMLESKPALAEKLHRILAIKLARRLRDLGSKKPEPSARRDEPKEERDKDKRKKKEEEEKKEPEAETPNSKFNKKFKLDGEVIIRELECSYKGSMTMHGSLFISQNYIGVDFSMFGSKKREAIPFSSITGIIKSKKNINITAGDKSLVFSGFADYDDAFQFIRSIWTQVQKTSAGGSAAAVKPKPSPKKDSPDADGADEGNKWLPSTADWELILKGARTATFKKDDVIIREGEQFRRIFQLFRGECRFEKVIDGKSKVLGKMGKDGKDDNLFGEIVRLNISIKFTLAS